MELRVQYLPPLVLFAWLALTGCAQSLVSDDESQGTTSTTTSTTDSGETANAVDSSSYAASVAGTSSITYNAGDLVANTAFGCTLTIDCTGNTAALDGASALEITGDGTILVTTDTGTSLTVFREAYGITVISSLEEAVRIILSGTLDGTFTLESAEDTALVMDGVAIDGEDGPAFNLQTGKRVFIVLADGSVNSLTDSTTRSDGSGNLPDLTMKAALFSRGPLVFSGEGDGTGSLSVTGNYKHAIYSKDYIRVCGGTLGVNVTARNAIQTVNGFIFDDGTLTVRATGDKLGDESKGIKVEGSEDSPGAGWIVINGGTIDIVSVSKGITAAWDVDEDATTDDTADDPDPSVTINSGIITVATTGEVIEEYTASDGSTVSCSPEGIEGKAMVTVSSGFITVSSADDCLNAGTGLTVSGGYLVCTSSDNDAIDSNGSMTISGGVILASGSEVPEEAFDCDDNTFTITGGYLVGISGTTSIPTAAVCTQNAVLLGSGSAGTHLAIRDSAGNTVLAFIVPKAYSTLLFSSPDITDATVHTVYTGSTIGGDSILAGMLYLDNLISSGGTAGTSFTTTTTVTSAGGTGMTVPGGGGTNQPGRQP